VYSINYKPTLLNQGLKPQISQSDTILLKQISDRIANLEGSLLLKSQNHHNYNPRFDRNSRKNCTGTDFIKSVTYNPLSHFPVLDPM
jgi:hypothetical protein